MDEPLLSARRLTRAVGGRVLWQHLSFDVRASERLAVGGPSGSGKSALLRALAGLDAVQEGEVRFQGKSQAAWPMPQYRALVMYLPQRAWVSPGDVRDNLKLPFALRAHEGKVFSRESAAALLAALGRDEAFLGQDAAALSGGEAQLVALVRALLLSPTVLLLDEATGALDPEATSRAERLLREWVKAGERALIFVSHDPAQRERMATRELDVRDFKDERVAP